MTTIEAVGADRAGQAVQQAWLKVDVPQCGYCQSGQIMSATALLARNPAPTDADIDAAIGNERKASQRIGRLLRLNPDQTATVHILCYRDTVDERWVIEALKDLDKEKITYYDVK